MIMATIAPLPDQARVAEATATDRLGLVHGPLPEALPHSEVWRGRPRVVVLEAAGIAPPRAPTTTIRYDRSNPASSRMEPTSAVPAYSRWRKDLVGNSVDQAFMHALSDLRSHPVVALGDVRLSETVVQAKLRDYHKTSAQNRKQSDEALK